MTLQPYQLFPDLSPEEYGALKSDIQARGVQVPVEYDEQGNVLDGHHRVRACEEIGVKDWPRVVRLGMSEDAKREHVMALNLDRRHLDREQRADLAQRLRSDGWSIRRIADKLNIATNTVLANTQVSQYETPETVTGADGKQYPARKPVSMFQPTPRDFETLTTDDAVVERLIEGQARTVSEARRQTIAAEAKEAVWPTGKYRVLYADPPWSYGNTQPDYHPEQRDHYPVMSMDEICALPIESITTDNAVLFLWATSPILEDAFRVIRAWGFVYKAGFIWDKVKHNMGHYNSVRHEFLLVCTRGACQPDTRKLFDSVVQEERTEHSRKPDVFRSMIETLYTHGPYIELFARQSIEGWTAYGNEIN